MPSLPGIVSFQHADVQYNLKDRKKIKQYLKKLFHGEHCVLQEITYVFCSDEFLLQINQTFLKHDYYTDIITFPLQAKGQPINAEIYISVDRVRENAKQLREPLNREMLRVILHGALHLCGYKDKRSTDKVKMRKAENKHLQKFENG